MSDWDRETEQRMEGLGRALDEEYLERRRREIQEREESFRRPPFEEPSAPRRDHPPAGKHYNTTGSGVISSLGTILLLGVAGYTLWSWIGGDSEDDRPYSELNAEERQRRDEQLQNVLASRQDVQKRAQLLLQHVGKYPRDALAASPTFDKELYEMLGDSKDDFDSRFGVQVPITKTSTFFVLEGCRPHACSKSFAVVMVSKISTHMFAFIVDMSQSRPALVLKNSADPLPEEVAAWMQERVKKARESAGLVDKK